MANNVDKFITPQEHMMIDHTGFPGVGVGGTTTIVGAEVIEVDADMGIGDPLTKTIPANTLTADLQMVEIRYTGTGSGASIIVQFDGNTILSTASPGTAGQLRIFLVRTAAGTCRASAAQVHEGNLTACESSTFALDWSAAKNITFSSSGGQHYIYQALKWPEAGSLGVSGIGSDTLPVGTIVPYSGTVATIPTGFLPCDGFAYDSTVETELFAVIGTTWNTGGEPGGFFRVPDLRGRSVLGLNDGTLPNPTPSPLSTRMLAATGGEEDHQLTIGEMPSHTHPLDQGFVADAGSQNVYNDFWQAAGGGSTLATGGDGAHNTMHPFAVCAYIIKSSQVGGGIGVTVQNNGGALQGPQPTLNLIPGGGVGISAVDNPGLSRVDVPLSASSNTTTVPAGSTVAQINTALTNFDIVYLAPGNYPITLGAGQTISIPDGKQLLGSHVASTADGTSLNDIAVFTLIGTATINESFISINGSARVGDIHFDCVGATVTAWDTSDGLFEVSSGTGRRFVEIFNINVRSLNGAENIFYIVAGAWHIHDIQIFNCNNGGKYFRFQGSHDAACLLERLTVTNGIVEDGIWVGGGDNRYRSHFDQISFEDTNFSNSGIYITNGGRNVHFSNLTMDNCQVSSGFDGMIVIDEGNVTLDNFSIEYRGNNPGNHAAIKLTGTNMDSVRISNGLIGVSSLDTSTEIIFWTGTTPSYCHISNITVAGALSGQTIFSLAAPAAGTNRCQITNCFGHTGGGAMLVLAPGWYSNGLISMT